MELPVEESFTDFVSSVSKQVSLGVHRLVPVSESIPVALIERTEYRAASRIKTEKDESLSQLESVSNTIIRCSASDETALIESGINFVRLSLRIQWEGPDACFLTRRLQETFFTRLGRASSPGDANIPILRKEPLKGYDVTFLFSCENSGIAEPFLSSILVTWRQLTKTLRLHQILGHRRAGSFVFEKIKNALPVKQNLSEVPLSATESAAETDSMERAQIGSFVTEFGDLGKLADLEGMLETELAQEDQFIIN